MIHKLIKYAGTKTFMIPLFKEFEKQQPKCEVFVESFVGGGAVFINTREYDQYYINDVNKYLIRIYETLKNIPSYNTYIEIEQDLLNEFGDIKNCKECYYNLRDYINSLYETDTVKNGVGLFMVASGCINSLFRTGPNGFNQSYGNRYRQLDSASFEWIKKKFDRTVITTGSYEHVLQPDPKVLHFLDPPYYNKEGRIVGYNGFGEKEYTMFLDYLKNPNLVFMYTDTIKQENSNIQNVKIREFITIAPSKNKKEGAETFDERLFLSSHFTIKKDKVLF